jgi:hypothetical protein
LVSFLHSFRFAVRLLGPLPLIFMMVFLSFGLNDFLLHNIIFHRIFLVQYMARSCNVGTIL